MLADSQTVIYIMYNYSFDVYTGKDADRNNLKTVGKLVQSPSNNTNMA